MKDMDIHWEKYMVWPLKESVNNIYRKDGPFLLLYKHNHLVEHRAGYQSNKCPTQHTGCVRIVIITVCWWYEPQNTRTKYHLGEKGTQHARKPLLCEYIHSSTCDSFSFNLRAQ